MAIQLLDQETQVRSTRAAEYDDTIAPALATYETNPVNLLENLNHLRSQMNNVLQNQAGNWYDDLNTPVTLDAGTQRGVNDLNSDLHLLERKRVLVKAISLADVTVGAGNNYVILGSGQLPPNTTAAVGIVTTRGTIVAAHGGTFGTHSLTEVSGSNAIAPKNFVLVVQGSSRDPILSSGRQVYGLLHGESGVTDGTTITITTPNRVQVSFVRINATGDDLEAVPVSDIENQVVNFCFTERKALEDLSEQDFLRGAVVDVPASATVTRQVGYDNQGTTPVDLTTNATLDLEGAGLVWSIRDDAEAALFRVIEGSAGGTSEIEFGSDVDIFDCNAVSNDFANGVQIDTGSASPINIGVTDGHVETSAGNLHIQGATEIFFDDGNQTGSTWAQTDGIKLSDTTAEWDDFETEFGEVSLLRAIVLAKRVSARRVAYAVVTANVNADTDVSLSDTNIDAALGDLSQGTFTTDYDFYLNGQRMRPGANAAANFDVYPGTDLDNGGDGQTKWERKLKVGDTIGVVDWAV
jgi:hypothetical protein